MKKKVLISGLILGAIFLIYKLFLPAPSLETSSLNLIFKPMKNYNYEVNWEGQQKTLIPFQNSDKSITDNIIFKAKINFVNLSNDSEIQILEGSITEIKNFQMSVFEKNIFNNQNLSYQDFINHKFYVYYLKNGKIQKLAFNNTDTEFFKNFIQTLMTKIQFKLDPNNKNEWITKEERSHGISVGHYKSQKSSNSFNISRLISQFEKIFGHPESAIQDVKISTQIKLSPNYELESLIEEEKVKIDNSQGTRILEVLGKFNLQKELKESEPERKSTLTASSTLPPNLEERILGKIYTSKEQLKKILQDRIAKMTITDVEQNLLRYGSSGEIPDHNRWFWRATGLLKLYPELTQNVVNIFKSGRTGEKGEALIFDLLAGAGTNEAQSAMKKLINYNQARSGNFRDILLYQRFSFVENPNDETLDLLKVEFKNSQNTRYKTASAYTLGSAISNIKIEDSKRIDELNNLLLNSLKESTSENDLNAMIRALGNAGQANSLEAILDYSNNPYESVRASVATALRKIDTVEANDHLLSLALDSSKDVSETSMMALDGHTLTSSQLSLFYDNVNSGKTPKEADQHLVTFLAKELTKNNESKDEILNSLKVILQRNLDQPNLSGRIREILNSN